MPATSYEFGPGDSFTIRLNWETLHLNVSTFVEALREPSGGPFDPGHWTVTLTPTGERALRDLFEHPPPVHVDVTTSPPAAQLGPSPKKRRRLNDALWAMRTQPLILPAGAKRMPV